MRLLGQLDGAARAAHQLFEARAREQPDAPAVISDDETLSYRELNRRANQLAHHLIAAGVAPEVLVGLVLDRSAGTLAAMLAILKAGGAYVPLDPALPIDRLRAMVAEARLDLVVAPSPVPGLALATITLLDVAAHGATLARQPTHDPAVAAWPETPAYCVFTSGSTGRPKGVVVPHAGLVNQVTCMSAVLGLRPGDRLLQFTSLAMDAALQEIFPTWLGGGALVLLPERLPSIRRFMELIERHAVSVVSVPSSYWHHWVAELARMAVARPPALRLVYVGGERILAAELRRWRALPYGRDVAFVADYGPTETTLSCMTFSGALDDDWQTVPLGRPIANMELHVLDDGLAPRPPGEAGELFIGGVGVSRGYLHRPGLTAERFVPNPLGPPGTRLYRTGDQGYQLPDGSIQFIGRLDDQVKVNGHRVELGDVECALLRCDGVREAAVVAHEQAPGVIRLIGYLVTPEATSESEIRRQLGTLLPRAMIPDAIIRVPELLRSPISGKIDRTRLKRPDDLPATPAAAGAATDLERAVAQAWTEVLGRSPQARDDDFFSAGGDSLRALRLLNRLTDLTGVELTFVELARAASLRALAAFIELAPRRARASGPGLRRLSAVERARRGRRPASHGQERLWFLHRLHGGAPVYSIPLGYRLRGALRLDQLDGALTTIAARHEALRTALVEHEGRLWQEIAPPPRVATQLLDAGEVAAALRLAGDAARRPFDLGQAPLFRSTCIRIAPDDHLLVLNFHHAVFDAWSLGIFWRELGALYAGLPLDPPSFQYADYCEWQRAWLDGDEAAQQRAFWQQAFDGELPTLGLARNRPASGAGNVAGAVEKLRFGSDLRRRVRELARASGVTEFAVLLAAFLATLHRFTRDEQIVVGVPVACRARPETWGVVGYFVNTLAVRVRVEPELGFGELIARTATALGEAMTHQELPLDEAIDAPAVRRPTDTSPVFQAMFVIQDTPVDQVPALTGLTVDEVLVHSGTAKVELTCALRSQGDQLEGELEHAADLFDGPGAARWLSCFEALLSDGTKRPTARLCQLALMDPAERQAAVARINGAFATYPDLQPLHARFAAMARHRPQALAIEAGGETISYGELDRRAARLAGALAAAGAGPERMVGICLPRSIELVVALLATLKAGAAFVPLDPELPIERMRLIAQDVGLVALVGHDRVRLAAIGAALVDEPAADEPAPLVEVAVAPENAAYVYYTSGSTGRPKGVVIDHRCAGTRLAWLLRRYQLAPGDRVVHKTPLIFDVAIWEIFGPLSVGATIKMADAGAHADVHHIGTLLGGERTVFVHFVPSLLDAYLSWAAPASYPHLRWVQLSGEAVSGRLAERFRERFSAELHNLYGQTETSEVASWEGATPVRGTVPIGRQIGAYRLFVLDDDLELVPPGVPGELCVAGVGGLARGYQGDPGLTAERFVPNAYAVTPGERLYRTGDLVSVDAEGVHTFLGRIDGQTKIRGCRVELGEVEAVLARHPGVRACAAAIRPDQDGAAQLIAYVVGDDVSVPDLAAAAERHLPGYMLPAAYVALDRLPLTPSGKLDRRALPAPTAADRETRATAEEPRGALERELCSLWQERLGLEHVGRADNFFALGGNSLKCLQVLNRVNASYGVELSVLDFLGAPTISGLAAEIEQGLVRAVGSLSDAEATRRLGELGGRRS